MDNIDRVHDIVFKSEFGLYFAEHPNNPVEINYIGNRILPIIENYSSHASKIVSKYKRLSFISALATSMIPITTLLVNYGKDKDWFLVILMLIAVFGSVGTAINTYISMQNYNSDGISKNNQAMQLRSEVHKYYTQTFFAYKHDETVEPFTHFVDRCEKIINSSLDICNSHENELASNNRPSLPS